ncbi:ABC transporter substrate-binding protein [Limisalsivibrio acetivorans]|uniref:ABC transporter substrate-binding protein n=1 Tax=Limisalsivibrio acetivorans TaxID=1304888 RepID=UPI0003B55DE6|nr:ABC transporter substrate-binding protein [Limisalsivibrio acetivorans]
MKKTILALMIGLLTAAFAHAETIKIGAVLAETGPASYLGYPEKQTLEMLVEEINAEGGLNGNKIELIALDTQGSEQRTINNFKRLVTKDQVLAVIGPTRTGSTLAIKPLADRYRVPLFSCAASKRIVEPTSPYVFKSPQSDVHAAEKIFGYMKAKGMTKAALITAQSGFGTTGRDALLESAKEMGITIVADEKFGDKDKDMTSQLDKIKKENPDAVICWGVGPAPAIVARNASQLGIENLFMSHGVASKKFIELAGDSANGIKLPAGRLTVAEKLPDGNRYKPVLMEYKNKFEKKFDSPVSSFGGHAYDSFHMFKLAYEKAGADREKIAKAAEQIKGFLGTAGEFNLSETDHNGLTAEAFIMVEIKDGNFEIAD